MIVIRDILFNLFGIYENKLDINKDVNGKGTHERYNEIVGKYIDEELLVNIDKLVENTLDPNTALERFIPYLEDRLGVTPVIADIAIWRRRVLKLITAWYKIKGTKRCYDVMLGMLGFGLELTEIYTRYSFDSAITFDDEDRVFDTNCEGCSDYTINLTGTVVVTDSILKAIHSIVAFTEPINANLTLLTYNNLPIVVGSNNVPAVLVANPDNPTDTVEGVGLIHYVLGNDTINGNTVTLTDVTISQISSTSNEAIIDTATGELQVSNAITAGTYTVVYEICAISNPSNCVQGTVTFTITAASLPFVLVNHYLPGYEENNGYAQSLNILANNFPTGQSLQGGQPILLSNITIELVSSNQNNLTLDTATGIVSDNGYTGMGSYQLVYKIIDNNDPSNTATASVFIDVQMNNGGI